MNQVLDLVAAFLLIYMLCIFVWALISWLPMVSPGMAYNDTVRQIRRFLDSVILPYVRLFRFVPPIQAGGQMIDLSAMAAILALIVMRSYVLPQLYT